MTRLFFDNFTKRFQICHSCTIFNQMVSRGKIFKGSPDQSHFIFEINVGNRRIRHITTLNLLLQRILVDLEIHHSISASYVGSDSFRHRLQK